MCSALWLMNPRFVCPAEAHKKTIMLCMSKLTRKRSAERVDLNNSAEKKHCGSNPAHGRQESVTRCQNFPSCANEGTSDRARANDYTDARREDTSANANERAGSRTSKRASQRSQAIKRANDRTRKQEGEVMSANERPSGRAKGGTGGRDNERKSGRATE